MDNRNAYWDSIKGLLIFIVVLGHSLEMDRVDRINLTTYELIYSFHMPLFMFLSGLFTNPNPERNKFKKSLFRIIETYIVFNLLYMVFYMDFPTTLIDAFTPYDVMWYLYILIIFRVCLYIYTERISHKIMPLFMGSIIVATLIGYIPFIGDKLCASRFFYFMPFFLAGILLKHKLSDWRPRFSLIHKMGAVLFLAITFTSIYLINNPDYFILLGAKSYNELDVRGLMGGVSRLVVWCLSIAVSISFVILTPNNKILTSLGQYSLGIYLMHNFFVRIIRVLIRHFELPSNLVVALCVAFTVTAICYTISKSKYSEFIYNPITSIKRFKL